MNADSYSTIQLLSKDLSGFGYSKLALEIKKNCTISHSGVTVRRSEISSDFSDDCDKNGPELCIDNGKIIGALVSVCAGILKDLKLKCSDSDSVLNECNNLKVENLKLKKENDLLKKRLDIKMNKIKIMNEKCLQLEMNVTGMERMIKKLEKDKLKIFHQDLLNEKNLKHAQKKLEKDVFEISEKLYEQSYLLDMKSLPKNFMILNPKYPDFKKLWSEVKYSSLDNREKALKKSIYILKENNEFLLCENSSLKSLIFFTLEGINHAIDHLSKIINVSIRKFDENIMKHLFLSEPKIYIQKYKDYIDQQIGMFFKIVDALNESTFFVDGSLFLCLEDVVDKMESIQEKQLVI